VVKILANWIKEYGNKPTENTPSEITNLILVCFDKIEISKSQIEQLKVY